MAEATGNPLILSPDPVEVSSSGASLRQKEEDRFAVNIIELTYTPPKLKWVRDSVQKGMQFLAPLNIQWMFPNYRDIGQNSNRAPLHRVNARFDGGKVTGVLGNLEERNMLMSLMVGRNKHGTFEGDILMTGPKITASSLYHDHVAHVQRKPLYISGLTYHEMLIYSARLKMKSSGKTNFNLFVADRVNELISIMNLVQCKNRKIPEYPSFRGEQGSDFRRLSIAMEIIDLPPLLVMEEPTLNFDPAVSVSIMQCLRTLAERGHAVVVSMKKPYIQEMAMLDRVCLLSDGYSIFCSSPKHVESHFCSPQMGYELKKGVDIVDFCLDISSGVERPQQRREADLPQIMQENFETSDFFESPLPCRPNGPGAVHTSAFPDSFFRFGGFLRFNKVSLQLYRTAVIMERAIYTKFKDTEILRASIGACVILGLFLGYLQWDQASFGCCTVNLLHFPFLNTANTTSLMFFMSVFTFAFPFVNVHVITQKLQVFRYEHSAGVCSVPQFLLSLVVSEVPFLLFFILIFLNIVYWMSSMGLGYENYKFFMTVYALNSFIGLTSAVQWGALLKREMYVRDFFYLMVTFMALLSGFPFQLANMTSYLADASCINPLRWCFEAMMAWKFNNYEDGQTWLESYSFQSFHHNDVFAIQNNFLWAGVAATVLFLIPYPVTLKRIERSAGEQKHRDSSFGRDSIDGPEALSTAHLPRLQTRTSELQKPLLFMRDSSVTGHASKLSVNLSQIGEENAEHGPTVLFKDISYNVRDSASPLGYKTILHRVSGQFDWGKLSMIMGAPESGKSSLIHILAGDVCSRSEVTGKILYNSRAPDTSLPLWQRCGLVPVHSEHNRDLTVREVLTFAMKLRCHNRAGFKVVEENVGSTAEILHLFDIMNKRTKKLTPGELKRLSIAEEMVHGPKLLFIDEPTTGVNVVESSFLLLTFREMVNQDRTVVVAMSQPRTDIFRLFDTLMLLSKGRVIYFGPIAQSTKFFLNSPFQFNAQNYTNPAEFLADISGGFISDNKGDFIDSSLLENYYMSTDQYSKLRLRLKPDLFKKVDDMSGRRQDGVSEDGGDSSNSQSLDLESHEQISERVKKPLPLIVLALSEIVRDVCQLPTYERLYNVFFKGGILLHRATIALLRRYELIVASTVTHILLACMFGWIMGDTRGVDGVYNAVSFFAMSTLFLIIMNVQFIFFLHNSREVFIKEHARGLYTVYNFWSAQSWPLYVLRCVNGVTFITVAWSIIELTQSTDVYGFTILCFMCVTLASAMMAETVVYGTPVVRSAYTVIPAMGFLQFLFSGLFLKSGSLPSWLAPWTPSCSIIRWSMQANYINLYKDTNVFPVLPNGYSTYTSFLVLFGWGGKSAWECFFSILIFVAVFRGASLIATGISAKKARAAPRGQRKED